MMNAIVRPTAMMICVFTGNSSEASAVGGTI